jgi:serine/threonine protein phosphatase PrpC
MKGKMKSFLSCIPDVLSYEIDPTKDDFIFLSTDGIFQSMSIAEVVSCWLCRRI